MKFKDIRKTQEGRFITRYDLTYEMADGQDKVYEMISRSRDLNSYEELAHSAVDAVVMILHDESGEKILLNREFRMTTGNYVFNFPAGLMEPGESPKESAKRELFEETGLNLVRIDEWLNESYTAIGFSNEKNICCVGAAEGTILPDEDPTEEIEARWYTKAQVRELLKSSPFAARTQAYCYLWSKA